MPDAPVFIHPTADVHPQAQLASGAWIGPQCVIGEKVAIGRNTRLTSHVVVDGRTEIGADCLFSPFSVIGTEPQDIGYKNEETLIKIGDRNKFREFMTVHRATVKGGGVTSIGSDNYFMAYSHIAHDCRIGNRVILTNNATLGGHVIVEDFAYLSGLVGVHQFSRIGKYAFIGGFTVITHDVVPFAKVAGVRPIHFYGMNAIGLRRQGFSADRIRSIKEMFRILFHSDLNTTQALQKIEAEIPASGDRDDLLMFIRNSKRGIVKKVSDSWDDESE